MSIEVVKPGPMTTVQEWPGRLGLWPVGVPPSGPMDDRSFRLANRAAGNPRGAAALEVTVGGLHVRFDAPATIALGGADVGARLDGVDVALWEPLAVAAGQELKLGWAKGTGLRAYLALAGGIGCAAVLGSRATFPLGRFGGHEGRALQRGDRLVAAGPPAGAPMVIEPAERPALVHEWKLAVLTGPHGAPEFFTPEDLGTLFSHAWEVGAQSDRTGVRLAGPAPRWARPDGGDAGLHPSNLHDNAYVVGSLILTGDTPVFVGPDGPSLGGFVSPCVVAREERWKLGQLRAGDRVRLVPAGDAATRERPASRTPTEARQETPGSGRIGALWAPKCAPAPAVTVDDDVLVRRCGDGALLVEFGPCTLDLRLRLRAHGLQQRVEEAGLAGVRDLTPGIRSLQVQFDPTQVAGADLVAALLELQRGLESVDDLAIPGRVVHLPLSWDDPAAREAVERYMRSVRPDAPWCPDNIEFIRRINGLNEVDEVRRIVFDASYLVMGLGDVYLGAPVAVALDPRHRLVTTKYDPARMWTPENAVGIGGAYLCVYGMEGPGGYQLVGRTLQVWNPSEIASGTPWLLRPFDQLRFHPVSTEELDRLRAGLLAGEVELHTEPTTFRLGEQEAFAHEHRESIAAFRAGRQAAFAAERSAWQALAT
ncbi:MAG: 5-oxoprolinase/urea amidolyase family protein [Solirubrobacteraceae bacterium MAG38_C4-C5]|nr:5-oxoprolinase/urea amidolyase family protein [Candidatus Siliceabacter maunaloa]